MRLAIHLGRHTYGLGEETRKIVVVLYTQLCTDIQYSHSLGGEQFAGALHLHDIEVGDGAITRLAPKERGEIGGCVARMCRNLFPPEPMFQVLAHILRSHFYHHCTGIRGHFVIFVGGLTTIE